MYLLTIYLSRDRERTGVIEIGLKSLGCDGFGTFGIGVITAVFHWRGTTPSASDWLNS
jgi:hypothetical protein